MPRTDYQAKLDADNRAVRERSRNARDIAEGYPPPGDLEARTACERDLRLFLETYFPNAFALAWSADHLKVIARLEEVVLRGGLFALAMPRGSGKTTLSIRAAIWALLYGHRRFVCLVGATERRAADLLKQVKAELLYNERLAADFREVCYPLQCLENNARRCIGQLFEGRQTRIDWSANRLTFPTMPDHAGPGLNVSGSTVSVAGLTGALRGQSHPLPDGSIIRPEVAILDDPQTRESAMSRSQSESRTAIIKGDVLGMAGPGRDVAAILPCTVIREGDLASEMLDRDKNPEWSGQRSKLIYAFPANQKLWEEYERLRSEGLKAERGDAEATAFYRLHRAEMDLGAVVAWPERFRPKSEISAVQHAMNLLMLDRRAFYAEYQNEPLPDTEARGDELSADQIAAKISRMDRGAVPIACNRITAFIDVQGTLLYYVVAAWTDDFSGQVIDYGTFPDQERAYFTLRDARRTLASATEATGLEGQIHGGLEALSTDLLAREWPRDDGSALKIERCLIDANWGASTDTIYQFCRQSLFAPILTPSHGKYIGASSAPMREYTTKPGDQVGLNWRRPNVQGRRQVRYVVYDANWWKSFVMARLATAMGDRGCLSLFGAKPQTHRLFADHMTAEFRVRTEGRGRQVDEWRIRPQRADNHWFDGLVGCAVAASMQGSALQEMASPHPAEARRRVSFAELQRQKGA